MLPVTGLVICKNEEDRIERCVSSMAVLCHEVIALDSGSTDNTVAVAKQAGAHVHHQSWLGFGAQKNAAVDKATQPWVLFLDADEWLSEQAQQAIRSFFASGADQQTDAVRLPRRTHFLGTPLKRAGMGKEWSARLFRQHLRYEPLAVHEKLSIDGARLHYLPSDARIEHDTARSRQEYADKLQHYAQLWAQQNQHKNPKWGDASLHAAAYWLRQCVIRGGFLDGQNARLFHGLHTKYVWQKYRYLAQSKQSPT